LTRKFPFQWRREQSLRRSARPIQSRSHQPYGPDAVGHAEPCRGATADAPSAARTVHHAEILEHRCRIGAERVVTRNVATPRSAFNFKTASRPALSIAALADRNADNLGRKLSIASGGLKSRVLTSTSSTSRSISNLSKRSTPEGPAVLPRCQSRLYSCRGELLRFVVSLGLTNEQKLTSWSSSGLCRRGWSCRRKERNQAASGSRARSPAGFLAAAIIP
jgi:hypothetical protein